MILTFFKRQNWRKYVSDVAMTLLAILPGYGWGNLTRGWLVAAVCAEAGENLKVAQLVKIYAPGSLRLGKDVYLGHNCYVGNGSITIGNEVVVGAQAVLSGANHIRHEGSVRWTKSEDSGLKIGDGVWIGARAIVLSGVTIGRGSVVAAGSVVTRSLPPNTLAAGVPAREIKKFDDL